MARFLEGQALARVFSPRTGCWLTRSRLKASPLSRRRKRRRGLQVRPARRRALLQAPSAPPLSATHLMHEHMVADIQALPRCAVFGQLFCGKVSYPDEMEGKAGFVSLGNVSGSGLWVHTLLQEESEQEWLLPGCPHHHQEQWRAVLARGATRNGEKGQTDAATVGLCAGVLLREWLWLPEAKFG